MEGEKERGGGEVDKFYTTGNVTGIFSGIGRKLKLINLSKSEMFPKYSVG